MEHTTKVMPGCNEMMIDDYSEKRLRKAVDEGLVREEIAHDFFAVLENIETLRTDNKYARQKIAKLQNEVNKYKQIYYEALRAQQREESRFRTVDYKKYAIIGAGTIFGFMFICTALCRMLFG